MVQLMGLVLNLLWGRWGGGVVSCPDKKCVVPFYTEVIMNPLVCPLSLSPLTIITYSIKASSKPITLRDETRTRHLNADAASTSISLLFVSLSHNLLYVYVHKLTIQKSHLVT